MEIQLTQGKVTTIDDVDADQAGLEWYAKKGGKTFYVSRSVKKPDGRQTTELLHNVIARRMGIVGAPDHIDRNGLNNRRDNLRPDPDGLAQANRGRFANNTSGFKGAYWYERYGKWHARVKVNGKFRHLGYFDDPIEAAKAYDRAALEAFGEFAFLNFPSPGAGQK